MSARSHTYFTHISTRSIGVDCTTFCNTRQRTATHYTTLQHTLQHTATHYSLTLAHIALSDQRLLWQHTARHTATHCTTHCNTLQHTVAYCNILQHTATHCNQTLQHTLQLISCRSYASRNLLHKSSKSHELDPWHLNPRTNISLVQGNSPPHVVAIYCSHMLSPVNSYM